MTRRPRTNEELDDLAFDVEFEVGTLVQQVEASIAAYGRSFPGGSSADAQDQALLEASLVHLRLLHEFLACTGGRDDDVRADDWPNACPSDFLDDPTLQEINKRVAHLSTRRMDLYEWDLPRLAKKCFDALTGFFSAIPPERREAFGGARDWVDYGRERFQAAMDENVD